MKRIVFFMLFLLTVTFAYSQECLWKTNKKGFYYKNDKYSIRGYSQSKQIYEKDIDVYIYKYIFLDVETNKVLGLVDEKEKLYIDFDDLSFKDSSIYLPEEILKGEWIHSYYFDALKAKNPKVILQNEPWWDEKNGWKPDPYGEYPLSWGEEFQYNYGSYYFTKFTFCNGKVYYFIDKIQKKDKYYYITSKRRITTEYDDETRKEYLKSSDYKKIQNYSEIDLIISLDGDYMDIYLNSTDNHLGTYCFADSETVRQLWFFARDIDALPVDFDNVRYPHHADGTSEYEDTIRYPEQEIIEELEEIEIEEYNDSSELANSSAAPAENLDRPSLPDKKDPDYWEILQKYYPDEYPKLRFEYLQKRTKIINTVVIPCAIVFGIAILVVLVLVIRKKRAK